MSNLPSPPFVAVDGIHNFRDLGGYALKTSQDSRPLSVRQNFIFRCAEPSQVTTSGAAKLKSLGITTMFDLRSEPEIERHKDKSPIVNIDGIRREFVPVFADRDYSPEAIAIRYKDYATSGTKGFTAAYADILENAPPSYRRIFMHIRDHPEEPFVVHCTAGKDRTGVLAALLLALAGVDDETIAKEYSLTELGLAPWMPVIVKHLMHEPALRGNVDGVYNMISARAANMSATLKMIEERYGGAEGYGRSKCSLSSEDIEHIRRNLIAKGGPINMVATNARK